jgi:hypothetical protein
LNNLSRTAGSDILGETGYRAGDRYTVGIHVDIIIPARDPVILPDNTIAVEGR